MEDAITSSITLQQAVEAQFALRPTLRQVLGREGFKVLTRHYPLILTAYPQLDSLAAFTWMHAPDSTGLVRFEPLLDRLLEVFLGAGKVTFTDDDHLSLRPPQRFRALVDTGDEVNPQAVNLHLSTLNDDLNDVLAALMLSFQWAQVEYWNAPLQGSAVIRGQWLQQMLKVALALEVGRQVLDDDERDVLQALLAGNTQGLRVSGIEVALRGVDGNHRQRLPNLLLSAERDERQVVLWCAPSGSIRAFFDMQAFTEALHDELAQTWRFDTLAWMRLAMDGDAFEQQAGLLLADIVGRIEGFNLWEVQDVGQLEALCQRLSDPAQAFADQPAVDDQLPAVPLPQWLAQASAGDRFEYQLAVQALAASQALSKGETAIDDIEDLHTYTARRLREQMRLDHPGETPWDPDQLNVAIAARIEQGDPLVNPVSLAPLRTVSLTQMAISRLSSEGTEVATGLTDAAGQRVDGWMNIDYGERLIDTVDIGGSYPLYVRQQLDDATSRAGRIQRFAKEWRSALLFDALRAKVEGRLCEQGWRVLASFCRSGEDFKQYLSIAPLALRCSPKASTADEVGCMFLIKLRTPDTWVLYRPLYQEQAILTFADLQALMHSVRAPGELQQSILDWLEDDVRPVYADGGFTRPHLHGGLRAFAHLVGVGPGILADLLQALTPPASAAPSMWLADIDTQMYLARSKAMLTLASRQSVSNAQQRWAIITRFGWMLFNLVTPLLPGPVGAVAWLVVALAGVKDDLQTLKTGSDGEKALAVADLLANLAMVLLHAAGSRLPAPVADNRGTAVRPVNPGSAPRELPVAAPVDGLGLGLPDFSWRNRQGVDLLSEDARQHLQGYRAQVSLQGVPAQTQWPVKGLFKLGEVFYARLDGHPYAVRQEWGGVRVVAADGREGPWLRPDEAGWRINAGGLGGMPPRLQRIKAATQAEFDALAAEREANGKSITDIIKLQNRLLDTLKPYDLERKAYSEAQGKAQTQAQRDALQVTAQALEGRRQALSGSIRLLCLSIEKTVPAYVRNDQIFMLLREAKFARLLDQEDLKALHGSWRKLLLDNDMRLSNRLAQLVDYNALRASALGVSERPVSEAELARYQAFRQQLVDVVDAQTRSLRVCERFDERLLATLDDPWLKIEDKQGYIHKAIAQRTFSTHTLRFQTVIDLAELAIDRLRLTDANASRLILAQRALYDRPFKEAGRSHGELHASGLSQAERIDVLDTALREYDAALGKADFLAGFDDAAIDQARLGNYRDQLGVLRREAQAELAQAYREQDQGLAPSAPRVSYRPRPGQRKVIRTAKGRSVVGELEYEGGGQVLRQHDPLTGAQGDAYQYNEGRWEELPSAAPASTPDLAISMARRRGTALVGEIDRAISHAGGYTNQPNTLSDLIDWRIEDMAQAATTLEQGGAPEQALAVQLRSGIERLNREKRRLLVDAYAASSRPSAQGLKYLHQQGQVEVSPGVMRKRLGAENYLDVYEIRRTGSSKGLWEAHFHYKANDTLPRAFFKGHLKLWAQRKMGRETQLEQARTSQEWIEIHRGDLRADQLEGIIPFD